MAKFHTPRDRLTSTDADSPADTADFQTPLWLGSLNTPTATCSINCSPSDLTPPITALRNLELCSPHKIAMDYNEPAPLKYDPEATSHVSDLHSKLNGSPPPYSRTNAYNSLARAISSTRMLHLVLGLQQPEPYQRPPEMPVMLEQRFMAGLTEYGLDSGTRGAYSQEGEVSAGDALGKKVLEDIREEKESPVQATHDCFGPIGLTINLPVWHSDLKAVAGQGRVSVDEHDMKGQLPGRPATARKSNLNPLPGHGAIVDSSSVGSASIHESVDTASSIPSRHDSLTSKQHHPLATASNDGLFPTEIPQRASSVPPVLFPSPRVEKVQCWDFVQRPDRRMAPPGFVPGGFAPVQNAEAQRPVSIPFRTDLQPTAAVPQIAVQSPSPKKPMSKKRGAVSQPRIEPVQARARADDDTAGLPTLAANQEARWKYKFPGNTYALFTIMLPWSVKMQSLYRQLPDPYLFSINAAFPYPVKPPKWRKLVSVAFYDTSVVPHREIRFIGPGDVAEISYNEVDVFSYPSTDAVVDPDQALRDSKVFAMKRALGLNPLQTTKESKDGQRAANGEGRWAYILIQGHKQSGSTETPPHVIVAWHLSAVTSTSECLHTIYPDNHTPSQQSIPGRPGGSQRFSSLQNLAAQYSASHGLHQSLRSASNSALLEADLSTPTDDGAVTLMRKVWKTEKAGRIPLIEGYRVDVQKWCGWLDAVGAGKGKVIVWEEKE